jgi:hypothetical protein
MAGAEVNGDWRSADFGKIKVGNTRYDLGSGFLQYFHLAGQLINNARVSTTTGRTTKFGRPGGPSRLSALEDFITGKAAPGPGLVATLLEGQKGNQPLNIPQEIENRFIPITAQSFRDVIQQEGWGAAYKAAPSIFGIPSQTYGPPKAPSYVP